jgi:hypothetical protein
MRPPWELPTEKKADQRVQMGKTASQGEVMKEAYKLEGVFMVRSTGKGNRRDALGLLRVTLPTSLINKNVKITVEEINEEGE